MLHGQALDFTVSYLSVPIQLIMCVGDDTHPLGKMDFIVGNFFSVLLGHSLIGG